MITLITCTFPDRETALALATVLRDAEAAAGGMPPEEIAALGPLAAFPPDGTLPGADGEIHYYNIVEIGEVIDPGTSEPVPGSHFLGAWRGAAETIPAPLLSAHVDRPDWWPRLG